MRKTRSIALVSMTLAIALAAGAVVLAQQQRPAPAPQGREGLILAPNRAAGEGFGPFKTMVIRGALVIDGTGAPPVGPVDIVVSGNRIAAIRGLIQRLDHRDSCFALRWIAARSRLRTSTTSPAKSGAGRQRPCGSTGHLSPPNPPMTLDGMCIETSA